MTKLLNPYRFGIPGPLPFWQTPYFGTLVASADEYHADGKLTQVSPYDVSSAISNPSFDRSAGGRLVRHGDVGSGYNVSVAFGLSKADIAGVFNAIEFGYGYYNAFGQVPIIESGAAHATPPANTRLETHINPDGKVIYYQIDATGIVPVYYSTVVAAAGTYHAVLQIPSAQGVGLGRLEVLPLPDPADFWYASIGLTKSADSLHPDGRLTKVSGTSFFQCGAYSLAYFVPADGKRATWSPTAYNQNACFGIDTRAFAGANFNYAVLYGFAMYPDSTHLQILENISGTPTEVGTSAWTSGDLFELRVSAAGVVTYWKNNTLLITSPRAIGAGVPIWVSGSLYNGGNTIGDINLIPL